MSEGWNSRALGVCYYPEQWPEAMWEEDAARMRAMGLRYVRIAEFSWSRIEPEPGRLDWSWLDRAIEALARHGLEVVLCTPTATPPKWLVDRYPDILAVDEHGRPRRFGSRRHYCFSSARYRDEAARITRLVADRYGRHPAVVAWQLDNEYGCHDTVLSYSLAAITGFRHWLRLRYGSIGALNEAWGTVFWSQEYRNFYDIDPPVATVTEANPAHRLDYRRFASSEVGVFNRLQCDILRERSPGRPLIHNFMGFFTEFDHFEVARDLDIVGWDSYPLGFTQNFFLSAEEKARWCRVGHPDIAGFHHDLYRGMSARRWWVSEQQPGPVNWAQWNPAPVAGAVRLWSWQAFAHGAQAVNYFRWRRAPYAQEQMHAGLHHSDDRLDRGGQEARRLAGELAMLEGLAGLDPAPRRAPVALLFDYGARWMAQITPHGADFDYLELAFRVYSVLRQLGLDVDVVGPEAALDDYRLVVLPCQMAIEAPLAGRLLRFTQEAKGSLVLGPRTASKSASFHLAGPDDHALVARLAGIRVDYVESLPPGIVEAVAGQDMEARVTRWRETLDLVGAESRADFADGRCALARKDGCWYVAGWMDEPGWRGVLGEAARHAGLSPTLLPDGLRLQREGELVFALNFSALPLRWTPQAPADCLLGSEQIAPMDVAIWKTRLADA